VRNALRPNRWATLLTVVIALSALPSHVAAQDTYPGETRDPSGIALVGALVGTSPYQVAPKNEQQAMAFDQALTLAKTNGNDMGYPWLDPVTGTLELAAVNDKGKSVALDAPTGILIKGAQIGTQISAVPHRITTAQASITQLNQVSDAATRLHSQGVPNSDLIYMTEPDQEHNRVIITISSLNEDLMSSLASRFGTDLIAVRVQGPRPPAHTTGRTNDLPPFWGGAFLGLPGKTCTTGFAWYVSQYAMLTAGHCASNGASTVNFSNYYNAGSVASGTNENWSDTTGSEIFQPNGQSGCCNDYHGDLALVRLPTYHTQAAVYGGSAGNPTSVQVGSMYPHRANENDTACLDGRVTGEWCATVALTGASMWYSNNGPNVWARNIDLWQTWNFNCIIDGDSGGPVYQYSAAHKVQAMGIISGASELLGSCTVYFTDIWDAWYGLPGGPLTTG
jgi:hypothetical protein